MNEDHDLATMETIAYRALAAESKALPVALRRYLVTDGATTDEAEVVAAFTRWLVAANKWHHAAALRQAAFDRTLA